MHPNTSKQTCQEEIVTANGTIQVRTYSIGKLLGIGSCSRCHKLTRLDTGEKFACKIIQKSSLEPQSLRNLTNQIKTHRSLHHPHIVGFKHFFEDPHNVYILLQLCGHRTLNDLLNARKSFSEAEAKPLISQIIQGVQYMHSRSVIHRDLKLGNILLADKMQVKIADFGLACRLEYEHQRKRSMCGTPNYIAPEVLLMIVGHSYEADLWSLGVIIYTMLVGKSPFEGADAQATYRSIIENKYSLPGSLSGAARDLLASIFVADPFKRASLSEIAEHDFFGPVFKAAPRVIQSRRSLPCNFKPRDVWVKKWVDLTQKYGLGFLMSDRSFGVLFNDYTRMSLVGTTIKYTDKPSKNSAESFFTLEKHPGELRKKVLLLQHFKALLQEGTVEEGDVQVVKMIKTQQACIFRLSSRAVQVAFVDGTQIILSSETRRVNYINQKGVVSVHMLDRAIEDKEIASRIEAAKEIVMLRRVKQTKTIYK